MILPGLFLAGERPFARLLLGGGLDAAPRTLLVSAYADGRAATTDGTLRRKAAEVEALRLVLRGLEGVTQAGLDAEIATSGVREPGMRNASPRYGVELGMGRRSRLLQMREPRAYAGHGLPKIEAFLGAVRGLAAFGGVKVQA